MSRVGLVLVHVVLRLPSGEPGKLGRDLAPGLATRAAAQVADRTIDDVWFPGTDQEIATEGEALGQFLARGDPSRRADPEVEPFTPLSTGGPIPAVTGNAKRSVSSGRQSSQFPGISVESRLLSSA